MFTYFSGVPHITAEVMHAKMTRQAKVIDTDGTRTEWNMKSNEPFQQNKTKLFLLFLKPLLPVGVTKLILRGLDPLNIDMKSPSGLTKPVLRGLVLLNIDIKSPFRLIKLVLRGLDPLSIDIKSPFGLMKPVFRS